MAPYSWTTFVIRTYIGPTASGGWGRTVTWHNKQPAQSDATDKTTASSGICVLVLSIPNWNWETRTNQNITYYSTCMKDRSNDPVWTLRHCISSLDFWPSQAISPFLASRLPPCHGWALAPIRRCQVGGKARGQAFGQRCTSHRVSTVKLQECLIMFSRF